MSSYTLQTPESAAESARPVLEKARSTLGFVPNLYAGLANAPEALLAYISLSGHFDKTSLTPQERQTVLLVASVENGCEFCVAAHSFIAKKMAGVPADVVKALREGKTRCMKQVRQAPAKVKRALRALAAAGTYTNSLCTVQYKTSNKNFREREHMARPREFDSDTVIASTPDFFHLFLHV